MFERFNEKAIKAIMLAQEESRRLGHNFVGTEQILLGLIGEGTGIAAKVLKSIGINLKDTRIEVEKIIGRGSGFVANEIPFTPRSKLLLKFSLEEARHLEHNYIGTEHLLLGLIREGEGVAVRVLENLGAVLSMLRIRVIDTLNGITETSKITSFENFTKKAIQVILFAEEEACKSGNNFIGAEQILLGLIREKNGVAAEVLKSMSVTLEGTRREVEKLYGQGDHVVPDKLVFTPRAKQVLEISSREAQNLGHNYIDTEHLLLGLIYERNNVAVLILENLHINFAEMRMRVINKLEFLSLGAEARSTKRIDKKTYKCPHCSHEVIAIIRPSECEICGGSLLIILN